MPVGETPQELTVTVEQPKRFETDEFSLVRGNPSLVIPLLVMKRRVCL
jgi:hypothetical protein